MRVVGFAVLIAFAAPLIGLGAYLVTVPLLVSVDPVTRIPHEPWWYGRDTQRLGARDRPTGHPSVVSRAILPVPLRQQREAGRATPTPKEEPKTRIR